MTPESTAERAQTLAERAAGLHGIALQAVIWDRAELLPTARAFAGPGWDPDSAVFTSAVADLVVAVRLDRAIQRREINPGEIAADLDPADYTVAQVFTEQGVILALFNLIHPPGTVPCLLCTAEGRDAPHLAPGVGDRLCAEHGGDGGGR